MMAAAVATAGVAPSEYAGRRAALRALAGDAAVVLFSAGEPEDDRSAFFQEANFFYLTGIDDAVSALIVPPADNPDTLFLKKRDRKKEVWTGRKLSLDDDVRAITGIAKAEDADDWADHLKKLQVKRVCALPQHKERILAKIRVEFTDCSKHLARLRMTKSSAELELLERAAAATMDAQRAAWRAAKPGVFEYQVAGAVVGSYASAGCSRNAFPPIVGSGPNSTVLHYSRNNRRMDSGELLLIDIGAECGMYAGDITRTIPVSGKFTPRQLEVYNAVLQASRDVIAAARPGTTVKRLRQVAIDSLNRHSPPLGHYLNHGVSHHVGLDVHDLADNDEPLKPNAVITVEPGVYIPEESIGVRIEDMVLITTDAPRVLTAALPVEAAAIEKELAPTKP